MNNSINDIKVALLVPSCDKYIDVLDQFFDRQERFMGWWNAPRYALIEEGIYERDGITVLNSNKSDSWADRVRKNVESLKEEYFILLLDDYFMYKEVSENQIIQALQIMKSENIKYYKLVNNPKVNYPLEKYPYISYIPNNVRYGINLAECIIRRDFFLDMLQPGMNVWDVEAFPLTKVQPKFTGYLEYCVTDTREILKTRYAIMHGKWVRPTMKYFEKIGLPIKVGDRGISSRFQLVSVKFYVFVNRHLSMKTIRMIKRLLKRFGHKFASDY